MKISYSKINNWVRKSNALVKAIQVADKAIVYITVASYVLLCALAVVSNMIMPLDGEIRKESALIIAVPLISFFAVGLFRKIFNFNRPYELFGYEPVILKESAGKSFPSRHVFSIFIIAMAFGQVSTYMMIFFMVLGVILAVVRVLGGVHFIRDVVAGAAIGVLAGLIGFIAIGGLI